MAVEAAGTVVDAATAEFVDPTIRGTVEVVDLATLRELAPAPFDRHRLRTPGAIGRNDVHWDLDLGVLPHPDEPASKKRMHVVHRDVAGTVDGYAVYEPTEDSWIHNRPTVKLGVSQLITTTPDAEADLWRYLCAIDWVAEVTAGVRAVDEDIRHLFVDGRVARQVERSDHMWVRLLDVPTALASRRYEAPLSIVVDVRDDIFGDAHYRIDGDASGASCVRTEDAADVTVGIDVLGALYLGGQPLHPYVLAGRVVEHREGAADDLDRGMRTLRAPWATTGF
jgi:predicted acetyltransferase